MFPYQELAAVLERELGASTGSQLQQVAKASLKESLFAKLSPGGVTPGQSSAALKKFLAVDASLPDVFYTTDQRTAQLWDLFRSYFRAALDSVASELSPFDIINEGGLQIGPGSNVGVDSRTFYTKVFEGPLTGTNPWLFQVYRSITDRSATWREAEEYRLAHCLHMTVVPGNKLFYVPKNKEIARTAATEPLLNLMVQAALGNFLTREVLPPLGIRLSHQQFRNREAALDASASGKMATIDLSSASDSISLALLEQICPPNFMAVIRSCRSPVTILPDGREHTLRMVSSMGNGFTFPLETLILSCAVKAAYSIDGFRHSSGSRDYFVFGDDIICRNECTEALFVLLKHLGFSVNAKKTFTEGPFRESCGVDAWEGFDVRGVYVKTLELDHHIYSAVNRLQRWGARHCVCLRETVRFLLDHLSKPLLRVPFASGDCSGWQVPSRVWQGKTSLYGHRSFFELRFCTPALDVPGDIGTELVGPHAEGEILAYGFNKAGVELAFLGGYATGMPMGLHLPVRPHEPDRLWHPRRSTTPWWDWLGDLRGSDIMEEFWWKNPPEAPLSLREFERWKTFVAVTSLNS